jgi:hypothetical protein
VISSMYAVIALDIANERVREAEEARLARAGAGPRHSAVRTFAARLASAGALALTTVATRLDPGAADRLDREVGASA